MGEDCTIVAMTSQSKRGIWLVAGIFVLGVAALVGLFLSASFVGSIRDLPHGYRLERSGRDGSYHVFSHDQTDGEGAFDGSIDQIGWDERFVLARVRRQDSRDGWFVLDTTTRSIKGPLTESEVSADPVLSAIPRRKEALNAKKR